MNQRTSVGLDVHARSVVDCGLDGRTGELFERRLTPAHHDLLDWIHTLPGPVAVTYEAGPTGFGLARFLSTEGIECLVAAPVETATSTGRPRQDRYDRRPASGPAAAPAADRRGDRPQCRARGSPRPGSSPRGLPL